MPIASEPRPVPVKAKKRCSCLSSEPKPVSSKEPKPISLTEPKSVSSKEKKGCKRCSCLCGKCRKSETLKTHSLPETVDEECVQCVDECDEFPFVREPFKMRKSELTDDYLDRVFSPSMVCPVCFLAYDIEYRLLKHLIDRHEMTPSRANKAMSRKFVNIQTVQCPNCEEITPTKTKFLTHYREKHPGDYQKYLGKVQKRNRAQQFNEAKHVENSPLSDIGLMNNHALRQFQNYVTRSDAMQAYAVNVFHLTQGTGMVCVADSEEVSFSDSSS